MRNIPKYKWKGLIKCFQISRLTADEGGKKAIAARERALEVLHNDKVRYLSDMGNRRKITRNISKKYDFPRGIIYDKFNNNFKAIIKTRDDNGKVKIYRISRRYEKDINDLINWYAEKKVELGHWTQSERLEYLKRALKSTKNDFKYMKN